MILIFALQLALPLVFIAWIAIFPAHNLFGFWIQAIATAIALLFISLAGIWLMPPWWAPYVFACLLLVAIITGLRRRKAFASRLPVRVTGWVAAILFLAVGTLAIKYTVSALASRKPPHAKIVNLVFPLNSGTYLIVNAGSDLSTNAHLKTLDASVPRFHAWQGQSYGVDIVKIDALGLRVNGLQPSEPKLYRVYGVDVLAPCDGEIVYSIDGIADMKVPETDRAHMAGNHLIIRCNGIEVLLGHLRPGSQKVSLGDSVKVGDRLAAVGNSGNTDEPHLHIHAQRPGTISEPMSGDPLPISFNGRFLVRNDRVSVP